MKETFFQKCPESGTWIRQKFRRIQYDFSHQKMFFRVAKSAFTKPLLVIARTINSKEWMKRHNRDQFVRMAKSSDMRSRGAFKLVEICKLPEMHYQLSNFKF